MDSRFHGNDGVAGRWNDGVLFVILAKASIHVPLDSRFHGNDGMAGRWNDGVLFVILAKAGIHVPLDTGTVSECVGVDSGSRPE